ncbi:MAG: hypothetical protein BWX88_01091 [Planctomycetes bacterium ADurb.Bin126]|nr:MAG: hypothetical protein BWX88_01091 [Planctomycetes bacterium ADurb.Bin126]HQL72738.1 hypothetical protein [Phycisphaerae bacterium]
MPERGQSLAVVTPRNRNKHPHAQTICDEVVDKFTAVQVETHWCDVKERVDLRTILRENDLESAALHPLRCSGWGPQSHRLAGRSNRIEHDRTDRPAACFRGHAVSGASTAAPSQDSRRSAPSLDARVTAGIMRQ